jgi:hypothetical protein
MEGSTVYVRHPRAYALRAYECVARLRPQTGKVPGSTSDAPDFPKIPLLSRDLEQRKTPAGMAAIPCTLSGPPPEPVWGSQQKLAEGWPWPAT